MIALFIVLLFVLITSFYFLMVKENQEYKQQELSKKQLKEYFKKGILK
jgi:preprotein translocase subunit YajC